MGHTWIEVEIFNLGKTSSEKVKALVDTNATLTVLPKALANKLEIKATSESDVETAGGIIRLQKAAARIKIKGQEEITPVLISEIIDKKASPLLLY